MVDAIINNDDFKSFLDKQKKNSVDLILTDPPYTISRNTGFKNVKKGVKRFAVSMDFGQWDHKPIDLSTLASMTYSVLRKGGTAIIWYDIWKINSLAQYMTYAGFKMLRMIIWNKTNPVPLNSKSIYLSNAREMAVVGIKSGKPTFHSEYDFGNYNFPSNNKNIHPTQKPLELFNQLVCKHTNPGDLIIDPFLGSGTTAVAAINNKRRFAGCDIDQKYVDMAKDRIINMQN